MTDKKMTTAEISAALAKATEELVSFQEQYDKRKIEEDQARRNCTLVTNELNRKQKEVDALIQQLRDTCDGNWKNDRRARNRVSVPS